MVFGTQAWDFLSKKMLFPAISIERNGAKDDRNVEYLSPKIRTPQVENCRKVIRNFKLQKDIIVLPSPGN